MGEQQGQRRLSSGITGYDEMLHGGFISNRSHLIRGGPGAGKTILGLHFLTEGVKRNEKSLLISLGEPVTEIQKNAAGLGISLEGVECLDLTPSSDYFTRIEAYDIFAPAEVEREPLTLRITRTVDGLKPVRVLADALTQFRYLATDQFQFRRQVHSFLRFLVEQGATVLFTSESSAATPDDDLQFIADGVTTLEHSPEARTITISKFRGSSFKVGSHALTIRNIGISVFPRLLPADHERSYPKKNYPSGVKGLDDMLHSGIEGGTITLISGPTGVGKTTVGTQFMKMAAQNGERSVIFSFDESRESLLTRSEEIGIPVQDMLERGTLRVVQVEPLNYSPDEFSSLVREEVEEKGASLVMVDSVVGYKLSMRGENLNLHIHAMGRYLKNMGVTFLLVTEIEEVAGAMHISEIGVSYLADNVLYLRYLEMHGEIHKAIGVLKKRTGDFEKYLRELRITTNGVEVGESLTSLRGLLWGIPKFLPSSARPRRQ